MEGMIKELPVITLFIPEKREILQIQEGSGCKMDSEDRKAGMIDYIDYTQYSLDDSMMEVDGGQIMHDFYIREKYKSLIQVIPEVLSFCYDEDEEVNWILLTEGEKISPYIEEGCDKVYTGIVKFNSHH